jgi:hypothetical protein
MPDADGVAIGRRARDPTDADTAARTRHVLDEHVDCPTLSNNVRGESGVVPRKALCFGVIVEYCL